MLPTPSWPPPAFDEAVSAAILARVDRGQIGPTLRAFVPDRAVVFGRQDRTRPGFARAVDAAERAGFTPVMRLAGGRAAVFHEGTIAISVAVPDPSPRETITRRFEMIASAVVAAIGSLGIAARVGEVAGEYCPGAFSVNVGGASKVAGLGQRLARHAAHVGGVMVVEGGDLVNEVLHPVYRHLGYPWDPGATGSLAGHAPVTVDAAAGALLAELRERLPGARLDVDEETVELAASLVGDHGLPIA